MERSQQNPDKGKEQPSQEPLLVVYGKKLGEISESLGHFTDEKTGGQIAYKRSGIHQETLHSDVLYFLNGSPSFAANMPEHASFTEVDRRVHVKDAINFSGYLIATAGILYEPSDEQQAVSKKMQKELPNSNSKEGAIALLGEITQAVWKTGYVPVASDLARLVHLDELMRVVETAIAEPKLQYIYKEVTRLVYTILSNNPPFDGDTDAGNGRGGGGGGGGKGPGGPRRGPGGGCGCGRIIHSTEETRQNLERLIKPAPQREREATPV